MNALEVARGAVTAGAEVEAIFAGASTRRLGLLAEPGNEYRQLFLELGPRMRARDYCGGAFGLPDEGDAAGVLRLSEKRGYPSLFTRLQRGARVLTF